MNRLIPVKLDLLRGVREEGKEIFYWTNFFRGVIPTAKMEKHFIFL